MNKESDLDKIYLEYNEEVGFERVLIDYKFREIVKYCKGRRALDLGCGIGLLTRRLGEIFHEVTGVDGSQKKIQVAMSKNASKNIKYACSLFDDFVPTGTIDTIIATNVLEHVDDPKRFLRMAAGWLSTNGAFIITVPNATGFHKRLGMKMGLIHDLYALTEEDLKKGHKKIYDTERLREEFRNTPLKLRLVDGIFFKPLSHKQMEQVDSGLYPLLYGIGKKMPDYCSSLIAVAEK